jgi:hypothetical protein
MIPVQTQFGASPERHQTATYSNRSGALRVGIFWAARFRVSWMARRLLQLADKRPNQNDFIQIS